MNSSYAKFLNPFSKSKKRYDCCESKQYCDPPPCDDCCLPPEPCIETCARPCGPPCAPRCGPPCAPPCADPCEPCDPCCPPPCDPCAMICAPTPPKPACETLPHPVTVKVLERVRNPYGGFGEGFEYPPCKNVYPDVFFKSSSGTRRRPCRPRNCSQIRIAPKCQVNQQMPTVNNCMFGQPQCAFPSYGMWNPAFQSMGSTPNMRWF